MMQLSVGSLIGKNTATHWAQTIKTPYAYGVIEVADEEGISHAIGKRVLDKLMDLFSSEIPGHEILIEKLSGISEQDVVSLVLFIPTGSVANIFIYGSGLILLKRGESVSKILDTEGKMSGTVHVGDIYVLASKTCKEVLLSQDLYASFDHFNAMEVAEKLTVAIQKTHGEQCLSGLIVEATAMKEDRWEAEAAKETAPVHKESYAAEPVSHVSNISLTHRLSWWKINNGIRRRLRMISHRLGDTTVRIAFVLLLVFVVSVIVGIQREIASRGNKAVVNVIESATQLVREGIALIDLNTIKSKEKFLEAKTILDTNKSLISAKTKEGRQVEELYRQIAENLPRATLSYDVTPELFFDAALQKTGTYIEAIAFLGDTMTLLDTKEQSLMLFSVSTKKSYMVAAGTTVEGAQCVAPQAQYVYVATSGGINAVVIKDQTVKKTIIPKSAEWQSIGACAAFGGNIYLLDTGKGRIWKYISVESPGATTSGKFSDLREYLNPDTFPDFSKATSMSIDGSIWVGTSDGKVMKFTQGREDSFTLKGIDPELGTDLSVFTDDVSDNIYILDKTTRRVVVVDKEGMYKAQYRWGEGLVPSALAVSEKQGKILLLSEGKLYSITIK